MPLPVVTAAFESNTRPSNSRILRIGVLYDIGTFRPPPATYRVQITPGSNDARWPIYHEDTIVRMGECSSGSPASPSSNILPEVTEEGLILYRKGESFYKFVTYTHYQDGKVRCDQIEVDKNGRNIFRSSGAIRFFFEFSDLLEQETLMVAIEGVEDVLEACEYTGQRDLGDGIHQRDGLELISMRIGSSGEAEEDFEALVNCSRRGFVHTCSLHQSAGHDDVDVEFLKLNF